VRTSDGMRLHAEIFGPPDAPPIVLSHGITCGVRVWSHQIHALSDRFRVIAYDQRGHGRSDHPRGARWFTIRALGQDLQAVLAQCLPDGEPAVIAGHSMGGISIMSWAQHFPTEVPRRAAAVALINTAADEIALHSGGSHMLRSLRLLSRGVALAPVHVPNAPGVRELLRWLVFGDHAHPEHLELTYRLLSACPPRTRTHLARSLLAMDLRPCLETLTAPTLVLAGQHDRLLPPVHSVHIARHLPNAIALELLPGVGHMAIFEAADIVSERLAELADRHLARVPARRL
jgi:pimeloyl-ACP methyl ester carboxylesterase